VKTTLHSQIHATCVLMNAGGVLLRGPSGAGKSDLALRLIDRGGRLVADDRVDIRREDGELVATAPAPLQGLIEIRGVGIVRMPCAVDARIVLVVDLVSRAAVERLPEWTEIELLGVSVARVALDPFEVTAPIKLAFAAERAAAGQPAASAA